MFGVEPLARIVRQDARIEVKVPAKQGRKAYSYFREGGEGEKKSSGVGKKAALIGGGLALTGLGAAALAMNRKKPETSGGTAPVSEPKKVETNNTARNAAIGVGATGLGVVAKMATSKKEVEAKKEETLRVEDTPERRSDFESEEGLLRFVDGVLSDKLELRAANNEGAWKPSMSREEADKWGGDSILSEDFYHGTSIGASYSIARDGFNLGRSRNGKAFGESIYMTEDKGIAESYAAPEGPDVLQLKVNAKKIFTVKDLSTEHADWLDFYGKEASQMGEPFLGDFKEEVRKELNRKAFDLALGYTYSKSRDQKDTDIGKERVVQKIKKDPIGVGRRLSLAMSEIERDQYLKSRDIYAQAFSRALERNGYDGMRVEGLRYLMIFNPKNIAVIKKEAKGESNR